MQRNTYATIGHRAFAPVALAATICLAGAVLVSAGESIPNASFEQRAGDLPAGWHTHTWGGKASFAYADIGHTGSRSVQISSDHGADAGWFVRVAVRPFAKYRLSGWIKTENVKASTGRGALLNIHNLQPTATRAITGTSDWTEVQVEFNTLEHDTIQINCLFGGWGQATGTAWYDDVRLQLLEAADLKPSVSIDVAARGEPIAPYIYGQFIEHLGRCIYGGIWAEMLEDRKFYYPVGHEKSPWRSAGEGTVEMVKEDSFVGEHTPLVPAGGVLEQGALGLVAGKQYTGRVWLKSQRSPATVRVSLVWNEADQPGGRQTIVLENVPTRFTKYPLQFRAAAGTGEGKLVLEVAGSPCLVGTASLMPADNVEGMRADTLELLRQLDAPIYRWPGGNFVSGYDWKDGIGDPDRRPPRKNPAWKGVEHNDFGIDEFMTFCRLVGTEPLMVVNTGLGNVRMAVEQVQYVNGAASTPMGRLRAKNGHPKPYGVKWWGIGNEMYGRWQLGHMPLEQYVEKHNRFVEAMRAADPSIKVIAVGSVGRWSEAMMTHCADHMDLISEHFYVGEQPGLISHTAQMRYRVHQIAEAHREYRRRIAALKGKDIRIALDEWNYWYGPHVYGELGVQYHLKDALGVACALNEFARNTDMYAMACYAQTVNVIGAIKTSKTAAAFDTTGLVLMLYRKHFGVVPVKTTCGAPLDAMAAIGADGNTLTVAIVNPTMRQLEVPLSIAGATAADTCTLWQIAGNDPGAHNEPGAKPQVVIEEKQVRIADGRIELPPCSVSLFALKLQ